MQWTEKYRPKKFGEIRGQEEAVQKLKFFLKSFSGRFSRRKRAIILYGPPGIGKTTLAYVAAKETDAEIFELNASDLRNKSKLHEVLRPVIEQRSLSKTRKLILVDEADGISAVDRGGLAELLNLISYTPHPVIITANDVWNRKLSPLRKKSELVGLREINHKIINQIMIDILKSERKFIEGDILTKIAIKAKGDLRAAINDLQAASETEDLSSVDFDERNKETDIFNVLKQIFKTKPRKELLDVFNELNMQLDEIMLWVEENIPNEYKGEELARAYDSLSKADIFKGRIYKKQYWRFLVYQNIFLSYGISASKKVPSTGFTKYKKPDRILKIWLNNQKKAKQKTIIQRYANHAHIGQKRAMNEFPIIKKIILSNPKIQKELKLTEEEIGYIKN